MNLLDVRTVILSQFMTDAICTAVLAFLWLQNRKRYAGTFHWLLDFAFQTTAVLLIALRGSIPDWISMGISNFLVIAGALLGYIGLTLFTGKRSPQIHNYLLLAVFVAVHFYFIYIQPDLAVRNLNLSLGLLIVSFQCVWLLLHRIEQHKHSMTQGVGLVFGGFCLVSIVRIAIILVSPHPSNDFFKSGTYDTLLLMSYQILLILLAFGFMMMVNQRLLKEIQTQEEKFAKAFRSSPYAITLTRLPDGRVMEVNDGFVSITGYSFPEVVGKTIHDLELWAREEDRDAVNNELSKNNRIPGKEFQFRIKTGELITGLFSAEIITIDDQPWILSSINDITERKQMENTIQARLQLIEFSAHHSLEELLTKTLDEVCAITDSPVGFYTFVAPDQETLLLQTWSTRTLQEFCTAEGKGLHYNINDAGVWVDCIRQRRPVIHNDYASLPHRKGLPEGHAQVIRELVVPILREGQIVAVLGIGNKAQDYSQKDINIVAHFADVAWEIVERKRTEQALQEYSTRLEEMVEARTRELRDAQEKLIRQERLAVLGQMAGSVGHELRNPLAVITNAIYFLKLAQSNADETVKEYLDIIENETHTAAKIITDLLDFARLKSVEREEVIVTSLVKSILKRYLTPEYITVTLEIPSDLPPVYADPRQIIQVLDNLTINACQSMASKGPAETQGDGTLTLSAREQDGMIAIAMTDTGVGISPENLGKIFEPLFTTKSKGIGLGLAVSKMLIEANGGRIEVHSQPGQGSTFTVYIPIAKVTV